MLELGNGKITAAEGRSQFGMWSVMKAPLLSGTDISRATKDTIATLGSVEVIAVNQDSLAIQGRLVKPPLTTNGDISLWTGPLSGNCTVALMVNTGDGPTTTRLSWSAIGLP